MRSELPRVHPRPHASSPAGSLTRSLPRIRGSAASVEPSGSAGSRRRKRSLSLQWSLTPRRPRPLSGWGLVQGWWQHVGHQLFRGLGARAQCPVPQPLRPELLLLQLLQPQPPPWLGPPRSPPSSSPSTAPPKCRFVTPVFVRTGAEGARPRDLGRSRRLCLKRRPPRPPATAGSSHISGLLCTGQAVPMDVALVLQGPGPCLSPLGRSPWPPPQLSGLPFSSGRTWRPAPRCSPRASCQLDRNHVSLHSLALSEQSPLVPAAVLQGTRAHTTPPTLVPEH